MRNPLLIALIAVQVAAAGDLTVPLQVDRGVSLLTTTLCVQDQCDSDTHPLEGEILLLLQCGNPPTHAGIRDLRLQATTNHFVALNLGPVGKVNAELQDLVIYHAAPERAAAVEPIVNGHVVFRSIPNLLSGHLKYHAEGLACVVVQLAGLKCDDDLNLADRSTNTIDRLDSSLTVEGNRVKLTGSFEFREFIDPTQPEIGRVQGRADFTAMGDLRPELEIEPVPQGFRLGWCRLFEGFGVERAADLAGPWERVEGVPESSPTEWSLTVPNDESSRFYRLRSE